MPATLLSLNPSPPPTMELYACEPASQPKYTPNKEMDAKFREDSRRRSNAQSHGGEAAKRPSRGRKSMQMQDTNQSHVHAEELLPVVAGDGAAAARNDGESRLFVDLEPVPAISKRHGDTDSAGDAAPCARTVSISFKEAPRVVDRLLLSGPVQPAASTGFARAKKPRPDATAAAAVTKRSGSKGPRLPRCRGSAPAGAACPPDGATSPAAAPPRPTDGPRARLAPAPPSRWCRAPPSGTRSAPTPFAGCGSLGCSAAEPPG
ncbi:hypothetical protein C2845_PM11G17530 [Panicum miliaceum]|uniref:Uncharacterized protein n=1 Tax=Panicum miliaceum TaxID=4540 RepID=A0A3L6RRV3_PANMI|nr:hypothetical protein C2845_PM11G17530 [Panicum miliaceum]